MEHYLSRLEETVKANWDKPALRNYKADSYTFKEVATSIARLHIFFKEIGINKGDKVALYAKNSARWGVSFFAINTYEAVAVPLLIDFLPDSAAGLADHSDSKVLLMDAEMWDKMNMSLLPQIKAVIAVGDFSILYSADDTVLTAKNNIDDNFKKAYPKGYTKDDVKYPTNNGKELAIINYTSGTTSAPKGVMVRYESISSNVKFAQRLLPCTYGEAQVSMLPMAHMYGLMFELIYPLVGGRTITYLGKAPTPALLLGAMKEVKPVIVVTVPMVMEKIFRNSVLPTLNKPAMKILTKIPGINQVIFKKIREKLLSAFGGQVRDLIMGGAPVNPEVEKWFKKFKLPYTVGYGMTEMAPLLAYESWDKFAPKSCGKVTDNMEVRIDSADPQNIVGEIQTRGINVMSGYFKNEEATKATFTEDGWMKTGDLGVIDNLGNIFIKGRAKNMLLSSNGQNIYPEEIEATLNNLTYIAETVVVQRDARLIGLAYLDADKIKKDGASASDVAQQMEENMKFANKNLPAYSRLAQIEIVKEPFAKTPKMSIKRFLYS